MPVRAIPLKSALTSHLIHLSLPPSLLFFSSPSLLHLLLPKRISTVLFLSATTFYFIYLSLFCPPSDSFSFFIVCINLSPFPTAFYHVICPSLFRLEYFNRSSMPGYFYYSCLSFLPVFSSPSCIRFSLHPVSSFLILPLFLCLSLTSSSPIS